MASQALRPWQGARGKGQGAGRPMAEQGARGPCIRGPLNLLNLRAKNGPASRLQEAGPGMDKASRCCS